MPEMTEPDSPLDEHCTTSTNPDITCSYCGNTPDPENTIFVGRPGEFDHDPLEERPDIPEEDRRDIECNQCLEQYLRENCPQTVTAKQAEVGSLRMLGLTVPAIRKVFVMRYGEAPKRDTIRKHSDGAAERLEQSYNTIFALDGIHNAPQTQ